MRKIILAILPVLIIAEESSLSQKLDNYHIIASKWVMDESDVVDRYLSGSDDNKKLSDTKVTVAYEVGLDDKGKFSNSLDFSLELSLPRFQDRVKLTLEKVNQNKSLLESKESHLSKSDSGNEDSYNLALKFSQWRGKKSSIYFTGGIRFNNDFLLEPYIGLVSGYSISRTNKVELNIKNRLRYYLAGEVKDNLSTQLLYNYKSDILLGWLTNFEYTNKSSNQLLTSEFIFQKELESYKFYRVGAVVQREIKNFKNFKKSDYSIYTRYHNRYRNKDWMFYEITPSLEWKKENDYRTLFNLKLKVGATFGGLRDLLHKK